MSSENLGVRDAHQMEHGTVISALESLCASFGAPKSEVAGARARSDAISMAAANGEAAGLAVLTFASEIIAGLAQRGQDPEDLARLAAGVATVSGLPADLVATGVCLQALRDPRLVDLSPQSAVEAQLRTVFALSPAQEVSLWTTNEDGQIDCSVYFGGGVPTRRVRAEARQVLRELPARSKRERALIQTVPVTRGERTCAALVVRSRFEDRARCLALAEEAAAMVRPVLERESLLERTTFRQESLVESSERRLTRLGFDLHDGPLQDVAALAGDVRLFREQLTHVLAADQHHDVLLGRIDDLEARLSAIDGELRELAHSFESSAVRDQPFAGVLRREVEAFGKRTDVRALVEVKGDLSQLTASQRIALLRIVQEALANVREHSGATEVQVTVLEKRGYVRADVVDNGAGFDVEQTLIRAARSGRLGLVGMNERVRLLGGSFDVQSRPGGPTAISVRLPEWRPHATADVNREATS
jgi:signal transduction histidine kinase